MGIGLKMHFQVVIVTNERTNDEMRALIPVKIFTDWCGSPSLVSPWAPLSPYRLKRRHLAWRQCQPGEET